MQKTDDPGQLDLFIIKTDSFRNHFAEADNFKSMPDFQPDHRITVVKRSQIFYHFTMGFLVIDHMNHIIICQSIIFK